MKKGLLIFILLIAFSNVFAQGTMKTRKWKKSSLDSLAKAQLLFEEQNFLLALPIYQQLQQERGGE